jgi:hypothetical protein
MFKWLIVCVALTAPVVTVSAQPEEVSGPLAPVVSEDHASLDAWVDAIAVVDTDQTPVQASKGNKPIGAFCRYSSECEQRPGVRCARPRGSASKVKTRCMSSGY